MATSKGLRGRKLSLAVWGVAMWAIIISGFNQASAGGVLGNPLFLKQFPQLNTAGPDSQHKSTIQGTVVALYTLCSAFGSLATSYFGDYLGRRRTIFVGAVISAVGAILMGTSYSFAQFIVSRIVAGLGTGGITATVSAWHSELSRAEDRGSHVSGFGFFVSSGLAVALWLEFGMSYAKGPVSWRFPLSFPAILALVAMSLIFTVPESPRWLVKRNRVPEARRILGMVYEADEDSEIVDKEIRAIQVSMELAGAASFSHLFTMGRQRTLHRLVIAFTIMMFLQISGVNALAYYAPQIFENELHFGATTSGILAASSQLCLCLGAIVCSVLVDRLGRRKLLLFSATMMSVCMACMAGLASVPGNRTAANVGVFFVFLYYFVYVIGFLGIPFLYASEIAPVHLRAAICGLSTAGCWLFNFVVVEITPVAFNNIGYKYFIVYAAINAACVPVIFFFYPETMGRSLEEIDQIFIGSKSIFDPVKLARSLPKNGLAETVDQLVEEKLEEKNAYSTSERDGERN